ncbi:class I SAM-dependent methyltransferase [bacterium]|nr:class I SAM-dependent methyltransferase [bacterium]
MPLFKKRRNDRREKRQYGFASAKNNYKGGRFISLDEREGSADRRESKSGRMRSGRGSAVHESEAGDFGEAGFRERGSENSRNRIRAKEQASALLSPEQESALRAISLLLSQNRESFASLRKWLFIRAHYYPELFYPDLQSGLDKFAPASADGEATLEQSSARAYKNLARRCLKPKDFGRRRSADCLLFLREEEGQPEVGMCQPWSAEETFKPVYDAALILGTSSRAENYVNFSRALRCVRPGGLIVFSIVNGLGAASFEKAMSEVIPLHLQLSKYHCRTFAVKVPESSALTEEALKTIDKWHESFAYRVCGETGLLSRPGIFSWNKLDGGSALLADYLRTSADLRGVGADLGSANGVLTKACLESVSYKAGNISRIDLFEDEYLSLAAAKLSLKGIADDVRLGFNWADVISDVPSQQYDWIVMNPPFHQGQTRVLNLGREFVASAARALTWRGTLYVVVNRTLPYEDTLATYFKEYVKIAENNGFKVYKASSPIAEAAV